MSNPSIAIGEHGQLSGRFPDACQLQLGIAVTKGARMRRERLGITGLKHLSDSTPSRRIVDDNEPPRASETGSLETASSSKESAANLLRSAWR